ncbi:MAG: dTDP-4-dehydrorhamnose 3,5-epimerase [Candidimonas sp.]|jgi:dTDP-4-dehydrorhamnose 3,5-epimerase
MKATRLAIPDVVLFEPEVFEDARGFFFESFNQHGFEQAVGRPVRFVQDNHSQSGRHVLRGLHYQIEHAQGKLTRAVAGEIFDVAVDMRRCSPTFGRWVGEVLSADNRRQLWIPEGFAHGFVALGNGAQVLYKTTDFYAPRFERSVRWNDPDLAIRWPVDAPVLSPRDAQAPPFSLAEPFAF